MQTGCGRSQTEQSSKSLSPRQVKNLIDQKADVLIIDVRTTQEFNGELGHINGAVLHPVQEIDQWAGEYKEDKNREIIMVCRIGNRSGSATKYFSEKGFTNVFNMTGGMKAWNKDGFPVAKQTGEDSEK